MDLYLETDDDARTLAFIAEQNAISAEALETQQFEADRDTLKAMFEREDRLIVPARRGRPSSAASFTRCASPPDSSVAGWPRRR